LRARASIVSYSAY